MGAAVGHDVEHFAGVDAGGAQDVADHRLVAEVEAAVMAGGEETQVDVEEVVGKRCP